MKSCEEFNKGLISQDALVDRTVKLGFNNVIDAFHVVNSGEIPVRFFYDERSNGSGINLSDDLLNLFEQTSRSQNIRPGYNAIPFIPPFTSAPDNLRVESRASYKKVRK